MTDALLRTARETAPGTQIEGWTSQDGPAARQGTEDGLRAEGPLLRLVAQASHEGASALIIGCFDDTALTAARQIATCPVIEIGQTAYHFATLAGERLSVVTTVAVPVPTLEANIHAYGLHAYLERVRASGVSLLAIKADAQTASHHIIEHVHLSAREDNVQSVVLGCGGMVDIDRNAPEDRPICLIDGHRPSCQCHSQGRCRPHVQNCRADMTAHPLRPHQK